jgi:hypothetical protein
VPQPPRDPATADLDSQVWGPHEHHRAACPRHAVADNTAARRAPKRAPVSRADHEHITRAIGEADQNPAGWPSLHLRLHSRPWLRSAPHRRKGPAHALARHVAPGVHEPGFALNPRRPVTAGRLPGKDRDKNSAMRQCEILRVTQRGQAPRRAANPGNHPAHARHDNRRPRRTHDRCTLCGRAASRHRTYPGRGALPDMTTQPLIPEPRRADTHPVRLPTRLPGAPANKARPVTGSCQRGETGTHRCRSDVSNGDSTLMLITARRRPSGRLRGLCSQPAGSEGLPEEPAEARACRAARAHPHVPRDRASQTGRSWRFTDGRPDLHAGAEQPPPARLASSPGTQDTGLSRLAEDPVARGRSGARGRSPPYRGCSA